MSGKDPRVLAEEQAALRRVATLVARGSAPEEVFAAVTKEIGQLLPVEYAYMSRYEPDRTVSFVTAWGRGGATLVGGRTRVPLGGNNLSTVVFETGRSRRIDDYGRASGPAGVAAREEGVRSAAGTPIIVEGRVWGMMVAGSSGEEPLPADTEARLSSFTELLATAIANAESRAGLARLAEEQAALRRVATLVAQGVPPEELFATVTEEVGRLLPVDFAIMRRYEPDGTATLVAASGTAVDRFPLGGRLILEGKNLVTIVFETGRPARIDSYGDASGPVGVAVRETDVRSAVGTPIIVEGRPWGVVIAGSTLEQPMSADTEARLADFTELLATAIANTESRAGLARLAGEQAALRRVATLVARGAPQDEVFAAVNEEVGWLVGADPTSLMRFEVDDTVTLVAAWSTADAGFPIGARQPVDDELRSVRDDGRVLRFGPMEPPLDAPFVEEARRFGVRSGVVVPIVVDGRVWGVAFAGSTREQPFPEDVTARIAGFTELVATAIANAESRAALAASRARIVAAADETRRRIERDLHDGAQQRLISLGLALRAAQAAVPPQLGELDGELSRIVEGLAAVFDELREISHGIHPAILSERGLAPALRALARRSAVPVELDLHAERRLPEHVEVAAYYVVSEALTNAAKHAHASVVNVELDARDPTLRLAIRDDGIGGADPGHGSGLVGLGDRIAALGGTLQVTSAAGDGTTLLVEISLESESSAGSPEP